MRRKDREITDINEKMKIIAKNKVCRLGLSENNQPYIIPLNYGYSFDNGILTLYFHSAKEGKKLEIIKNNNRACFEIDCDGKLIEGIEPCTYSYAYKSIIGTGTIIILNTMNEKSDGLCKIMRQQTGIEKSYSFEEKILEKTTLYKMAVEEFTGKQREWEKGV